jgi:two-component system, NtrC family, sensor kinase
LSADRVLLDEKTSDDLRTLASFGFSEEFEAWRKNRPIALDPGSIIERALREARPVQVLDTLADSAGAELAGKPECSRTMLAVPVMRDGKPAGVLILTRINPQLFDDRQIEAAAALADLATVLISNGALLAELRSHAALSQPRDPALPAT